jgi:hypothetical protein
MLLLDSIEQERWYSVIEVAQIGGWSEDVVRRWIRRGLIEAFIQPGTRKRRRRVYCSVRIQGCEIARFMKMHLSKVDGERSFSRRLQR